MFVVTAGGAGAKIPPSIIQSAAAARRIWRRGIFLHFHIFPQSLNLSLMNMDSLAWKNAN